MAQKRITRRRPANMRRRTVKRRGGAGTPPKKTRFEQYCDRLTATPQDAFLRTVIAQVLSTQYPTITPDQRVALVLAGLRDDPEAAAAYVEQAQHDATLMPVSRAVVQSHPWKIPSQRSLTHAQREFIKAAVLSLRRGQKHQHTGVSSRLSLEELKTAASQLGIRDPTGNKGHKATWINAIRDDETITIPKEMVLHILEYLTPAQHMSGRIVPRATVPMLPGSVCPSCKKPWDSHSEHDRDFCEAKINKYSMR